MKGTKQEASLEGHGKHLAERWGLPYREAHTLSIDPATLEIIDREESRRLRVLPVEFGSNGAVFAVAEPSEERFAAVRDLAGDNVSFVVVAEEALDALLTSKVFGAPTTPRRPALFRTRTGADESPASHEHAEPWADQDSAPRLHEQDRESDAGHDGETRSHGGPSPSTDALDSLLSKIATGTGNLRAQVEHLTSSLEATQRELREANEQLATAHRITEGHDEVVSALRTEVEDLRAQLSRSTALNESMTSRLQEVASALIDAATNDSPGDQRGNPEELESREGPGTT